MSYYSFLNQKQGVYLQQTARDPVWLIVMSSHLQRDKDSLVGSQWPLHAAGPWLRQSLTGLWSHLRTPLNPQTDQLLLLPESLACLKGPYSMVFPVRCHPGLCRPAQGEVRGTGHRLFIPASRFSARGARQACPRTARGTPRMLLSRRKTSPS